MNFYFQLPTVNAVLNSLSTVLIVVGYLMIRQEKKRAHIACMVAALVTSGLFLTCYLLYHWWVNVELDRPGIKFTYEGVFVRKVYYTILITHVLGAMINLPMIIMTVVPALRKRFERHKRIARWTLPLWLYVSVTGVIVYLMLYKWFPSEMWQELVREYGAS